MKKLNKLLTHTINYKEKVYKINYLTKKNMSFSVTLLQKVTENKSDSY